MSSPMAGVQPMNDRTIIQLNIDHFTRLLTTNLDHKTRQTVEQLLAEARADLHGSAEPLGGRDRPSDEFTACGLSSG